MSILNQRGEVCDLLSVDQFIAGKSAFECVAFVIALLKYAGLAGRGPTGTPLEASNLAEYWYGKLEGSNDASNKNGMSLAAEYAMLQGVGLHFWGLAPTVDAVRASLAQGVPVALCGAETGMYDMELGDHVPYGWTPTGNHCVVVSGIAHDGNLLVHDTANIDATGKVRPGPRTYDAAKVQIVSATAVMVPGSTIQAATQESKVPEGWHDQNGVLTAPNGIEVVHGFRDWVLAHAWDKDNWPLEAERFLNPIEYSNVALGAGSWQPFRWKVLEWTEKRGVFEGWCGQEVLYLRNKTEELYNVYQTYIKTAQVGQAQPGTIAEAQIKQA